MENPNACEITLGGPSLFNTFGYMPRTLLKPSTKKVLHQCGNFLGFVDLIRGLQIIDGTMLHRNPLGNLAV